MEILKLNGLNFKLRDEELVSSNHELMQKKERKVIEQLQILFSAINLVENERNLLIKISVIPNLPFTSEKAKRWFSLTRRTELLNLRQNGWIKSVCSKENQNVYYIHSMIASAIRAQYKHLLYETSQSFIKEITKDMIELGNNCTKEREIKILTQFGWSIADIFDGKMHRIEDFEFLQSLAYLYGKIGLTRRELRVNDMAISMVEI